MSNDVEVTTRGLLQWVNGSWVRPASGHTDTGVTAIRANRGVWDEIDLWKPEQFETSQMMVQGTERNPAQRLYISTQYNAYGLMSTLLRAADVRGYKVYRWDVFSGMQQCPSCREHDCPLFVVSTKDGSGFEPLCKGRGLRSRGYVPYEAVIDEFLSTDLATWRVQKLLEEPEREYLILPMFDERKHVVSPPPEAAFFPATVRACGVDWGFDHPLVFSVWAEVGDVFWGIHEHSERFVSPDREIEIAEALQEQFGTVSPSGAKELVFWCGADRPEAIAQFNERGLIAAPCPIRMREARHRAMRRLLRQDRIKLDREAMPLTVFQLSTCHRDERSGREVLEDNDCFDAAEAVLSPAEEFGSLIGAGGFFML